MFFCLFDPDAPKQWVASWGNLNTSPDPPNAQELPCPGPHEKTIRRYTGPTLDAAGAAGFVLGLGWNESTVGPG